MNNEIEATFLAVDKKVVRKKLEEVGFKLVIPEYLMKRKTFDFSIVDPGKNKWGRVRQEFDKVTMTVKEVQGEGILDTFEIEVVVDNFERACEFFEACNIPMKSHQENLRELWVRDGVEVTIDTWPGLSPFVEVEGESEEIIRVVSSEIGFRFAEAVFGSINVVYEMELGIPSAEINVLPEITFAHPPSIT